MSYQAISRFVELQKQLALMQSQKNIQQSLRPAALLSAQQAKESFKKHAPVGQEEEEYDIPIGHDGRTRETHVAHGRPSRRLFGTMLSESWTNPVVEEIDGGQSFTVMSSAPHMPFLLFGTAAHPISKRTPGPMSFWSFKEGRPFLSHWHIAFMANHPGTKKSFFVQLSLARGLENQIEDNLTTGLRRVVRPIIDFFNR